MSTFSITFAAPRVARVLLAIAGTVLLSACASGPSTTYHWGGYERNVYDYLRADDTSSGDRISSLEVDIEKAKAENKPVPPGFHAHLGLLYGEAGRFADMRAQLEMERADFPESAAYIDFVLGKFNEARANAQP